MKRILSLFAIALSCITISAQSLPSEVQVGYPKIFLDDIVQQAQIDKFIAEGKFGQNQKSNRHWIVYSDRSNNKLYTTPGGSSTCGVLGLGEKVRIAKIEKNGWALVYIEPEEGIKYPLRSSRVSVKGYIHTDNLLLWHTCPANEFNIYNKALLCANLDKKQKNDDGRLYFNPKDKSLESSVPLTTDMDFYFVMKREGDMVLLARQYSMDGFTEHNILIGWVREGSYVPWNQRSCLEPTWDRGDVEAFANDNKSFKVYEDIRLTKIVADEAFTTQIRNERRKVYQYRMPAGIPRFPILSTVATDKGDTLYKCSTFGVGGGAKNIIAELSRLPDQNSVREKELRDMSNIDIAIVIDGTKSMGPYFQAVKQGIKDAERFFESGKFKIRIGLVIYRDYTDGEQYAVECYPFMDSESRKLMELLEKGGSGYGFKSSLKDKTYEEALYLGIDTALEKLNFDPKHSNLMFVIGDCGNHRDDKKFNRDEIVQKLVSKKVNLCSFQVNFGQQEAYDSFNTQVMYLMTKNISARYTALDEKITVEWADTQSGYELCNSIQSNILTARYYGPKKKGQSMEASDLTELMRDAVDYFEDSIDEQIKIISSWGQGFVGSSAPIDGIKIDDNFIRERVGDELYEQYKNGTTLLAFQGYTKKKLNGRNLYKPVLFISSSELEALLNQLQEVNDAAANQDDREPYINAMKALIISMSPGLTEEEIQRKKIGDVMKMVMGLHEAPAALKQYTLADIGNHKKVSQNEYRSLVKKFHDKYTYLNALRQKPYDYMYTTNNITYYWLPIEYLP